MIALISLCVISLVVWLVIVFLSVTEGIEKNWIQKLVSLNAPMRVQPTELYYLSHYYQQDAHLAASGFSSKTLGEKLISPQSAQDENDEPCPITPLLEEYGEDGQLMDLAREAVKAAETLPVKGLRVHDYELALSQMRLRQLRHAQSWSVPETEGFLTQVSYLYSLDPENAHLTRILLPPNAQDLSNILFLLPYHPVNAQEDSPSQEKALSTKLFQDKLQQFFDHVAITQLQMSGPLSYALFPKDKPLIAVAEIRKGKADRILITQNQKEADRLAAKGTHYKQVFVKAGQKGWELSEKGAFIPFIGSVQLAESLLLQSTLDKSSLLKAKTPSDLIFQVKGALQGLAVEGAVSLDGLTITGFDFIENASRDALWARSVSHSGALFLSMPTILDAKPVLLAKSFRDSGALIGDGGYISYYSQGAAAPQEMRLPIYVAGFYDPGLVPGKFIIVDKSVTAMVQASQSRLDGTSDNGFQIWFDSPKQARALKAQLEKDLALRGLSPFFQVESYEDYDFSKDLIKQLHSDRNLFTLIALLIICVACSNIISMLLLLVNDKKKEIGIFQALGASPVRIAAIFGLCGVSLGLVASAVGTFCAFLTLRHLGGLVDFLSAMQGYEAFNALFYGDALPSEMSPGVLSLVIATTAALSLLAGLIPAIKAARVKPASILRSE